MLADVGKKVKGDCETKMEESKDKWKEKKIKGEKKVQMLIGTGSPFKIRLSIGFFFVVNLYECVPNLFRYK